MHRRSCSDGSSAKSKLANDHGPRNLREILSVATAPFIKKGLKMRSILLWLVGVPIPIIILLWFFMR